MRIDGRSVDDELICLAFEQIESHRGGTSLTYFEYGTLAALWIFKQQKVDIALLEVGLGGRLDAVNIVDADVAVITSIDIDHQDWLGESRDAIGVEKAGIARAGRPLVCGDLTPPENMLLALEHSNADIYLLGGKDFNYALQGNELALKCANSAGGQLSYRKLPVPHLPLASAVCAVQALICGHRPPSQLAVERAFRDTRLKGRFQKIRFCERDIFLDVAHNPAAALLLADKLNSIRGATVYGLFAALADKDIRGITGALLKAINYWHICDLKEVPRSAGVKALALSLKAHGVSAQTHSTVASGIVSIVGQMSEDDILIVFGSFYTVAEALLLIDAST